MATVTTETSNIKPVTKWMRWNLLSSVVLCFFAGLSLFVGTEQTDQYSAWTINSHITAAFIGAAYWGAGIFLTLLSAREREWARARIAVAPTLSFTVLGLISTLLHFDRFHLNSANPLTQALTWVWLVPYAVGPILALVILAHQLRVPGGDPPREGALPAWLRALLVVQAVVLLAVGATLFIAPQTADTIWPWPLTPLTARVIAAWLVGLGAGALHVAWENDWGRVFAAAVSYTLFSVMELVVLARYPGAIDWSKPHIWGYLLVLLSMLVTGLYTWLGNRRVASKRLMAGSPTPSSV